MDMYAHLPVEDDAPDEPQGQLVVSIYNVCPSYVYQINLKMRQKRNDANVVAYWTWNQLRVRKIKIR